MLKKISIVAVPTIVIFIVIFFGVNDFLSAQKFDGASRDLSLAGRRLDNVKLAPQSIGQLFSDLSLSYDIPIGLEIASNDESAAYHIDFKKGTLSELLTEFVARHDQYTWEINDGVVNVFPKENYRDKTLEELLAANINHFSVKEDSGCWEVEDSLANAPEVRKIVESRNLTFRRSSPKGFYIPQVGRHFTLDVSNMPLKSILNKMVKESPTARYWLIKKHSNDQTFFIRLGARHEDAHPSKGN